MYMRPHAPCADNPRTSDTSGASESTILSARDSSHMWINAPVGGICGDFRSLRQLETYSTRRLCLPPGLGSTGGAGRLTNGGSEHRLPDGSLVDGGVAG